MTFLRTLIAASFTAAMGIFASGPAQAATVTVSGTDYNLTTDFINYDSNIALLQGQAWWGDANLAAALSTASASMLSTQNTGYQYGGVDYGAFFVYKTYPNGGRLYAAIVVFNYITGVAEYDDISFQSTKSFLSSGTRVLALEAAVVPLPAAAPFLLAGIGALGLMGRRRKS